MNKIIPNLWFDKEAEKAAQFYATVFPNTTVGRVMRYGESAAKASGKEVGDVLTVEVAIDGQPFVALNGGPQFTLNPSISFLVNFDPSRFPDARERLDAAWEKLSEGGSILMPLDAYPFSEHYGWVQDRFGVSWQLMLTNPEGEPRPFITPMLLFVGENAGKAEEAIDFYCAIVSGARGTTARHPSGGPDKEGTILFADFKLFDTWLAAMDSAHEHRFEFNEAISLQVECETQEEVDDYWAKLTANGGVESVCGWLKDRYGLSWQIVPKGFVDLVGDTDPVKAEAAMKAMMGMRKLDFAALKAAYDAA